MRVVDADAHSVPMGSVGIKVCALLHGAGVVTKVGEQFSSGRLEPQWPQHPVGMTEAGGKPPVASGCGQSLAFWDFHWG